MSKNKNKQHEQMEFSCEVVHQTAMAALVKIEDKEIWVPFSQIHYISAQQGKVRITPFIAKKNGLV